MNRSYKIIHKNDQSSGLICRVNGPTPERVRTISLFSNCAASPFSAWILQQLLHAGSRGAEEDPLAPKFCADLFSPLMHVLQS